MTLERIKKPQMVVRLESVQQPKVRAIGKPTHAGKPATPAQLRRAKARLEQDRSALQRASEQASLNRETRAASIEKARVQRIHTDAIASEQKATIQHAQEVQTKQQSFFLGFIKSPLQRKSLEGVKSSSVAASQARDLYQAAIVPEIVQRLVNTEMIATIQAARANQKPNDLTTRANWFNTELPVLRAKHNHPDTPFLDGASVFKPTDQQAFALGNTYKLQRLASGLTPRDAASAILNIQRKPDRDIALKGLLTGVNPRQSDYSSIQRLVTAGEHDLEVQRQALLEDAGLQSRALQLAKAEAHPMQANSGISEKIKAKLGGGNPLPENIRHQLEAGLNTNLEAVRVHTDGEANVLAKSVNAIAFTTGKDIFFSSGSFEPNTKTGYELIAHETTHTVQQASGLVSAGIDADSSLEIAAQAKGAELANTFNPNFKFKNLKNQAQPNSPLISSQPPAHRTKIQALQRSSLAVQRDPAKPAVKEEAKGTKLNLRGAAFKEGYTVKLRSSMETSSASNIVSEIPFGTTFLITEQITTWYKIKLDSGATGFVAGENISVAPDVKAEFYKIKPGDNAIDIASKHYKAVIGLDLRFYVGVLAKLNPKSIKMPDGIDWSQDSSVMAWKKANPMVGYFIWIPSQAYAASLKGSVNNGKLTDHPGAAAAEIGKGVVKKTIKDMGGDQVISTLESIGQNVSLIWDNPGAFMDNLQKSFTEGLGNFQAHFGEHLQTGVMQWLQSALGSSFDIPKTADSAGLLSVGLQVVGLDYNKNLRPMLASSLPNGGLAQLEASGGVLQNVMKTGSLTPVIQMVQSREKAFESMLSGLPTTILNSLKDFAIKSIVTAGIKKMLTMLVPGGGLVQAAINIYNAITFFIDRAKQIGAFVQNLTSSFASIAKGDVKTAVKTIEAVLGSGLSLALGFLASAAGLTKIASSIKAALDKIQKPAQAILVKVKDWIVKMFSSLVKKVTPGTKPVVGDKSNSSAKPTDATKLGLKDGTYGKETFTAGKEPHAVWLEVTGGHPEAMIASTAKPAKPQLDGWRDEALQKGLQAQVDPYIGQAMGIVTRAVKNLNKAASTNSVSAVTIDQMWKNDGKALVRVVTVIRNALGPEVNYAFVTDSSGVKRTKLVTISFLCPANLSQAGLRGEFTKQVEGQQEGLNKLTVPEWFTNRSSFLGAGRSNSEQRKYREDNKDSWLITKAAEIQTRPYTQELIVQLRKVVTVTELSDLQDATKTPRIAAARARTIAELIWKQQAALHDPDQNAGGNSAGISGVGDRDVNSSIGSQWKERVYLIDREVAKVPEVLRPDLKLNTRLRSQ
jgi:Domain of unknown function (DUF4157)/Novel toxin 15